MYIRQMAPAETIHTVYEQTECHLFRVLDMYIATDYYRCSTFYCICVFQGNMCISSIVIDVILFKLIV